MTAYLIFQAVVALIGLYVHLCTKGLSVSERFLLTIFIFTPILNIIFFMGTIVEIYQHIKLLSSTEIKNEEAI